MTRQAVPHRRTRVPGAIDAGYGIPWTPASITGLVCWYNTRSLVGYTDGDRVGLWPDLSGNPWDLTQGTEARKPVYKTGIVNGLPILRAANYEWIATSGSFSGQAFGSIFCVMGNISSTLSSPAAIDVVNKRIMLIYPNDTTWYTGDANDLFVIHETNWHGWINGVDTLTFVENSFNVFSMIRMSTTVSVSNKLYLFASLANDLFAGDIAEFLVYDSILSDADRVIVQNYLASWYGIVMP